MSSNLKIWYLLVLFSLLGLTFLLYLTSKRVPTSGTDVINSMTSFTGGIFEASGVAPVPGANGVLFVDNGRPGQVLWMSLDEAGKQAGAIKPINLAVNIEDIEGLTTDEAYFYAVSSQSRPKAIASAGLVRFKFDAGNVSDVETLTGLKQFLLDNVAELRDEGDKKSKRGGLNIEGLAWDPKHSRLLLGLRSPVVKGNALLIPLKFRNQSGPFSIDNLQVERSIALDLGGLGVRGIEYDKLANGFKIISGATEVQALTDFGLWEWNGEYERPMPREINKFDKRLKPEGLARVRIGSRDLMIIVFDSSGYTLMD